MRTCRVCLRPVYAKYWRDKRHSNRFYRERENIRIKTYRTYGPKTGVRKGPQPRNHPPFKQCSVCQIDKADAEFIIGKGRRGKKCHECFRKHQNVLRAKYDAAKRQAKELARPAA